MFSERLIDDVEKIEERPAYKYFTRAAKPLKCEKVASFERRREHGAPKDKRWHSKKFLCKIREDFARIQNDVLGKNGYSVRVDHRTLKAQKNDAEQHGDKFLSKVYDRMPEEYIGITSSHCNVVEVLNLKHTREFYQKKFEKLFRENFQEKVMQEEEVRACARQAEILALSLLSSESYKSEEFSEEPLLEKKFGEYQQRESDFKNANFENSAETIQEQYYLMKEKILLETARQNLQNTKNFLESESEKLAKICQTEEARQKISVIAAGILKKNLKMVEEYERAKIHSKDLSRKLKLAKKRLEGLKRNSSRKLQNYSFSVAQLEKESAKTAENDPNFIAELIADALNGNENAVQLVAYCPDDCLEMDKTWSLMSELDKDALLHKLAMRDL